MASVIVLFLLQFVRIKAVSGGLTGSVAVWFVKLMDIFAFAESSASSRSFGITALVSVLPVAAIYLVFGRAFCGWVCPMDFIFEVVDRMKGHRPGMRGSRISPKIGYLLAAFLLLASALTQVPVFTNYFSHLTNLFRLISAAAFVLFSVPVAKSVLFYSAGVLLVLILIEVISPRLWCRVLCPVGKTYGLFNKISFLRLVFDEGQCGECSLCDRMCYMDVKVSRNIDSPQLRDINCIYCGRCAEGCGTKGNLIKLRFRR